jgi:hypothetical protein
MITQEDESHVYVCVKGAMVTCLARNGPAEIYGVKISDMLLFVDDLDVQQLINSVCVEIQHVCVHIRRACLKMYLSCVCVA